MEDCGIIALFFARAENAITELAKKYGAAVRRVIGGFLSDRRDAEECESDTYMAVWNTVPPNEPDPLSAYVCRIGRNQAVKRYHANTAARRNSVYETALDELADLIPAGESPEDALDGRLLAGIIDSFLDGCAESDRWLFVRRYWFADSVTALAAATGRSPHYVSVRLWRMRERLRLCLEREGVTV